MIPFNCPPCGAKSLQYIEQAVLNNKISGDGPFTEACDKWIEANTKTYKALLTTSCTHALEMAATLCAIEPGDEVIMPSYTFVSTAVAFVSRGAKIIFVDIRPDTMNIDETLLEAAITKNTKAIAPVHYAGVACEMDSIMSIARRNNLMVVEDAAQGVMSSYKGRALGAIGDFGCFSFHETKNYSMGEGGALLLNTPEYVKRAETVREKGTNRSDFLRGRTDKYTWVDIGSSYLPGELSAAYLLAQLETAEDIYDKRMKIWNQYASGFSPLEEKGRLSLPAVPDGCAHNAHMFYIKLADNEERDSLMNYLSRRGITSAFHYVPLHSAPAGLKYGEFHGEDKFTTRESRRLLRLPMYNDLSMKDAEYIIDSVIDFFKNH